MRWWKQKARQPIYCGKRLDQRFRRERWIEPVGPGIPLKDDDLPPVSQRDTGSPSSVPNRAPASYRLVSIYAKPVRTLSLKPERSISASRRMVFLEMVLMPSLSFGARSRISSLSEKAFQDCVCFCREVLPTARRQCRRNSHRSSESAPECRTKITALASDEWPLSRRQRRDNSPAGAVSRTTAAHRADRL